MQSTLLERKSRLTSPADNKTSVKKVLTNQPPCQPGLLPYTWDRLLWDLGWLAGGRMNGFGFLSEELLRASVLVPKRRILPVVVDVDADVDVDANPGGERLPVELVSKRREVDDRLERLERLREQYAVEMQGLLEAQEEAKRAALAMEAIMCDIVKISTMGSGGMGSPSMPATTGPSSNQSSNPVLNQSSNPLSNQSSHMSNPPSHTSSAHSSNQSSTYSSNHSSAHSSSQSHIPSPHGSSMPSGSVELLAGLQMQTKAKFLPRKPRSLLFSRHDPDWLLTSTLDGSLQRWSLDRRALHGPSVSLPHALNEACWAEAMCVDTRGQHAALALASPSTAVGDAPVPEMTTRLCVLGVGEGAQPRLLAPSHAVHSKGLASVVAFYDGPSERSLFASGGNDKNVALWDADLRSDNGTASLHATTTELHRRHTSTVLALCQQPQTRMLWSGGADMRLVAYCLAKRQTGFETKLEGRLSHILAHSQDPQRLLLALARPSEQFRLLDCRAPTSPAAVFGWAEAGNTSRYLLPSWHAAGNLVACGSASPLGAAPGINVWDLRYLPHPLQRIDAGTADRRFAATLFHPTRDLLVALATDGSVSFIDYSLA